MSLFTNVEASLFKYCKDFILSNSLANFEVFNFDAYASLGQLPSRNLMGIGELSLSNQTKGLHEVTCYIGIVTLATDSNLAILRPVVGDLYDELEVGSNRIKLYNVDNSEEIGQFVIKDGVEILPVARTVDTRPMQVIAINLGLALYEV